MEHTLSYQGILTLKPSGRIDTVTSPVLEKEINEIIAANEFKHLVIDLKDVTYVSSAGLRIFLRLNQAHGEVEIVNVNQDVYEVFEMTGFSEIMNVQKAYRQFSIEGCEVIGKGACGVVYRVSEDTIVKVFNPNTSLDDIKRELEISHKAFILGIPTAISYDVVKVGDCYGTVYELLNCDTLRGLLAKDQGHPEKYAKIYSDLLHVLHASKVEPGELPDFKKGELERAKLFVNELPKDIGDKYLHMMEEIPEDHSVLHGDCHIKNIMVQNGEPLFIDMDTLAMGNPIFDFARAYNTYFGYTELFDQQNDHFMALPYDLIKEFWKLTVMEYFGTKDPKRYDELMNKFMVVGDAYLFHHASTMPKFRMKMGEEKYNWLKDKLIAEVKAADNLLL